MKGSFSNKGPLGPLSGRWYFSLKKNSHTSKVLATVRIQRIPEWIKPLQSYSDFLLFLEAMCTCPAWYGTSKFLESHCSAESVGKLDFFEHSGDFDEESLR